MSNLPALHQSLQRVLMTRPYDWQRAGQLQKEISMTIAKERHALGLIEAAKDLTDGPYRCGYPGCENGYIWRDACADGQCSDVIQIVEACPVCNAEATDEDYELAVSCGLLEFEDYGSQMDWQDIPALWNQSYPGIDYDEAFRDAQYSGI